MRDRIRSAVPQFFVFSVAVALSGASFGQQNSRDLHVVPGQDVRRWTDASGQRSAEATLLAADETKARLKKPGGKIVTVALTSLLPG